MPHQPWVPFLRLLKCNETGISNHTERREIVGLDQRLDLTYTQGLECILGSKSDGAACEPAPTIAREHPPGHMGGPIALQSELAAAE